MAERSEHTGVAIVGLGNILLADDGIGVHAIRMLREEAPEGIILAEVGTALLDALDLLEEVEAVVAIDAMQAGGAPGSIYRLDLADAALRRNLSLHEFGIAGAIQSLPVKSRPSVTVVGVEPAMIDYGMELSPVVRSVLPQVVEAARTTAVQLKKISEQRECNCEKV